MTTKAGPALTGLVTSARNGDQQAWEALVERYAPLVRSICGRYQLSDADTEDAGQAVWLHLIGHLDNVRALAGWLATTTGRESARILRAAQKTQPAGSMLDTTTVSGQQTATIDDELLTQLAPHGQQLIALLTQDPPVPYTEISARLGIPAGSIGPCRGRCLDKLRRHPAIAALINTETATATGETPAQAGERHADQQMDTLSEDPPHNQPARRRRPGNGAAATAMPTETAQALVSVLVSFTPVRGRSPATAGRRSTLVTDAGGRW